MTQRIAALVGDDYVDTDVAYLLGMLFGRGQLIEQGENRRLVITLDIKRTLPKLPRGVTLPRGLDLAQENERAMNAARRRINDLLDANVDIVPITEKKVTLTAAFVKRTIAWRDLKLLCSGGTDRSNFALPDVFFELAPDVRKEFVRGFADVAVTPSSADNAWGQRIRIAFPVVYANDKFAKQLCTLINKLGVPAKLLPGTVAARGSKKEHRIRPYAEDYESIGFHFKHKQILLGVLAQYNRQLAGSP